MKTNNYTLNLIRFKNAKYNPFELYQEVHNAVFIYLDESPRCFVSAASEIRRYLRKEKKINNDCFSIECIAYNLISLPISVDLYGIENSVNKLTLHYRFADFIRGYNAHKATSSHRQFSRYKKDLLTKYSRIYFAKWYVHQVREAYQLPSVVNLHDLEEIIEKLRE
jgi:hypothetical protein